MSAERTLTEIVAEGLRRHAEHDGAPLLRSLATGEALARYYSEHGPRLLAVAEAAMEAERLLRHALDESSGAVDSYEALWIMQSAAREALAAFDSAAGAREGEGR